ncbi:MAG TPA: hypothetical protein VK879_17205 [Candidatus Sulfomarinibacteraceae bacterium]|nr:hypothetical protein [Candidatus Sulfomarinibacteraceae bacterium]
MNLERAYVEQRARLEQLRREADQRRRAAGLGPPLHRRLARLLRKALTFFALTLLSS